MFNDTTASTVKAPTPAPSVNGGTKAAGQKMSEILKNQGAAIRATMTEDQKAVEGSKRDKVAFVASIGDPTKVQTRSEMSVSKPGIAIVGYRLKALENMTVPVSPLKADCKDPLDCEGISEISVAAGQTFDVNLVEMTLLITRPEYAGKFSGEGQEIMISSSSAQDKAKVRPIFRLASSTGSIKANTLTIADIVGKESSPNGRGTAVVKEEFAEKFGALLRRKSARKGATGLATKQGESTANLAAAFGDLYRKKYGQG